MPTSLIYLGIMLLVIIVWFVCMKRPIYEAVFLSFLLLLTITGTWENLPQYFEKAISTSLLYSMLAFVCMSILMTKTKIIDGCIGIILALIGRLRGGAGYAAVISSAFMGSLSGSGPGNVMATGAITIPSMKRSGFPAELAANIESNASYMGNMIPPSSNIVAAMGAFTALYPNFELSTGKFWIILWGISLWFVIQRVFMVWAFCKYYKVEPLKKEELPSLKETLKENWTGLLLPVIILLPFVLDYILKDGFFTERLGAQGAKLLSSSILLFIGGVASIYTCIAARNKSLVTPKAIAMLFSKSIKSIVPAIAVCLFGYMIGSMFADMNVSEEMGGIIASWNFGKLGTVVAICIITCFMGMVIPGSSLVVIFGSTFISTLTNAGCDPLLSAAMLPCICGVMCGITPPLGLGMYAGMTLAESDFEKTFKNNLWWVAAQFALEVIVLMGWLPILGL
ncbi:MAG: TRAP transporter large permease subunit [Ruminococcaceae bacterium]|nr:TRAP transporter large permease subunit [Oscillospiraceae bacterium]